jgi:hypothetical protein
MVVFYLIQARAVMFKAQEIIKKRKDKFIKACLFFCAYFGMPPHWGFVEPYPARVGTIFLERQ